MILPDSEAIYEAFGRVKRTSGKKGVKGAGSYSYAQASVLYDVLNKVALDSLFEAGRTYEVDLAGRIPKRTIYCYVTGIIPPIASWPRESNSSGPSSFVAKRTPSRRCRPCLSDRGQTVKL